MYGGTIDLFASICNRVRSSSKTSRGQRTFRHRSRISRSPSGGDSLGATIHVAHVIMCRVALLMRCICHVPTGERVPGLVSPHMFTILCGHSYI